MGNALAMLAIQVIIVISACLITMKLTMMGRKCYVPYVTDLAVMMDALVLVLGVREHETVF